MAWTRKSSRSHSARTAAKAASMLASSATSQGTTMRLPTEVASGRTRRSSASPWKVKASSAPCAAHAVAIPQASERSLATPMIRPRRPCISVPFASAWAIRTPVLGCYRPAVVAQPCAQGQEHGKGARMTETDPFALFRAWMAEAERTEPADANAMTLATATPDGVPSARIVLLKGVDPRGFTFFTNTQSRKGEELAANPRAALLFHWKSLGRQVRIEGRAAPVSEAEADAYFATRPRISRLGAWASDQSRPLTARAELERRLAEQEARFPGDSVPRPPHWSGYRLEPARFEFWQDMPFRLHDRTVFAKDGADWRISKLFP